MKKDLYGPLVSIGIPIFNAEQYIENLLKQLINQDYKNIEIIISDNCSTDNSEILIKKFCQKYNSIKYFKNNKNLGGNYNFNKVLELSRGEYFCWSSCKNEYKSEFISKCIESFKKNPTSVLCIPSVEYIIEGSREVICSANFENFLAKNIISRYKKVLFNFNMVGIYGLFKKSYLKKINKIPQILGGDTTLIQELSLLGNFINVNDILLTYVSRKNWNSINEDYSNLYYNKKKPFWHFPFNAIFSTNISNVIKNKTISKKIKITLLGVLLYFFLYKIYSFFYFFIFLKFKRNDKANISKLYYKFKYQNGIKIFNSDLFYNRFILPQILNKK